MKKILLLLLPLFSCFFAFSQGPHNQPKREFRAVWVATVANIDYPKYPTVNSVALKEQWKNLLDEYQKLGFNAIIAQVRPSADAFYPSDLVPWSRYLSGQQGQGPEPFFDPLQFMIEETHKRSMEFHAWLNPYRATMTIDTFGLSPKHVVYQHRDWIMRYGRRHYLNPARPEVRQHLTDVVSEIVERYDVDAIHFDDYFYPYKVKGEVFPDSLDFDFYGRGYSNIEDWRRSNIDALIEKLSVRIKEIKPHVQFGISPFGVWRNSEDDPTGSETRAGVTCYDDLYADVRKWMQRGWIDYVAPQIYWHIGYEIADYETILNWWSLHSHDCHLYIGHAAYKVNNNQQEAWFNPMEIPKQIELNRRSFNTKGSIYFSSRSLIQNQLGVKDSIGRYYSYPALLPELEGLSLPIFAAPALKRPKRKQDAVRLKWKPNKVDKDKPPAYYAVYRFSGIQVDDGDEGGHLIYISPFLVNQKRYEFIDRTAKVGQTYTYMVRAVNRQHSESRPSEAYQIVKLENGFQLIRN